MQKKHGLIGLAALFALVLSACNSSGGSTAPVSAAELIAKWLYRSESIKGSVHTKGTYAGQTIDTTTVIDTSNTYTGADYYIEFKADNTYTANSPESPASAKRSAAQAPETGTWSAAGAELTTISSTKDTSKVNVAISGSTLTGTMMYDETNSEGPITYTSHATITIGLTKAP